MKVRLRVTSGKNTDQVVSVSMSRFFIGRAEDCQLKPYSDAVSRYHCVLLLEGNSVLVRDLGSKNGTFVNDTRVQPEVELRNGDRLRIGELDFEVLLTGGIGGKKRPAVRSVQEAAQRTTTVTGPMAEEDLDFDVLFSQSEGTTVHGTAENHDSQADGIDTGTKKETRPQEASEPEKPAATTNTKEISADKGEKRPGSWHKKPAATNTRDAAGEALKQFLRGR